MVKQFSLFMKALVFCLTTLLSFYSAQAFGSTEEKEIEFLAPEKAFVLTVKPAANNSKQAVLHFKIAPGYQLYQNHLKFRNLKGQIIAEKNLVLPQAIQKQDEALGQIKVYRQNLEITVPVAQGVAEQTGEQAGIKVQYQGCAEAGFCYPPISKQILLTKEGRFHVTDLSPEEFNTANDMATTHTDATTLIDNKNADNFLESEADRIAALFDNQSLPLTLGAFLLIGIVLAFTPCVLPMVPILANILVGQRQPFSRKRSFTLSVLYIFSMASCYALAGVTAGLLGSHLSTTLQQPLVLISFSFLLLMFSLSQLNLIQVQVPMFISQAFSKIESKNHSQGSAIGAISMGAISALVASPCVTPALVGALTYIGQTGNALLGGLALFSLAFGMGLPLLVAATIGSHLLPKAGSWMVYIKYITGALLLVLAGFILLRAVPLNASETQNPQASHSIFTTVRSPAELATAISQAGQENKPVILDVYADWCVSCRQMDKEVFENKTVLDKLNNNVQLLRLDLTKQNKDSEALQKELGIIGPPMVIFYWPDGQEAKSYRLAGKPKLSNFMNLVTQFLQETQQKQ